MTISGETIDYGPCAFMDAYDPDTVFSSIDRFGRYRYGQQPGIAHWNLARLAESLLPLLDADERRAIDRANEILSAFSGQFERAWLAAFRAKIGLATEEAQDAELIRDLLSAMHAGHLDFTNTFRALAEGLAATGGLPPAWIERWSARLAREGSVEEGAAAKGPNAGGAGAVAGGVTGVVTGAVSARDRMRASNPAIIPRNHRVEEALSAAEAGDFSPFERLVAAVRRPFDPHADDAVFREPAPPEFCGYRTFCGT
jgi:uncharacterized protein YdiU (UPF0061 family)